MIDARDQPLSAQTLLHAGVRKGLALHDMAPVTPDSFEIQEHRLALLARLREQRRAEGLPGQPGAVGGAARRGRQQQDEDQHQSEHGRAYAAAVGMDACANRAYSALH